VGPRNSAGTAPASTNTVQPARDLPGTHTAGVVEAASADPLLWVVLAPEVGLGQPHTAATRTNGVGVEHSTRHRACISAAQLNLVPAVLEALATAWFPPLATLGERLLLNSPRASALSCVPTAPTARSGLAAALIFCSSLTVAGALLASSALPASTIVSHAINRLCVSSPLPDAACCCAEGECRRIFCSIKQRILLRSAAYCSVDSYRSACILSSTPSRSASKPPGSFSAPACVIVLSAAGAGIAGTGAGAESSVPTAEVASASLSTLSELRDLGKLLPRRPFFLPAAPVAVA
jgi:hypothetical protein